MSIDYGTSDAALYDNTPIHPPIHTPPADITTDTVFLQPTNANPALSLQDMRLPESGLLFGLPIVLDTDRADLAPGTKVCACVCHRCCGAAVVVW